MRAVRGLPGSGSAPRSRHPVQPILDAGARDDAALTDDGAAVYASYGGLLEMNDKVQQAIANGTSTDFNDQYFRTNPRFETGDQRYAWLNQTCFVGEGRVIPGPGVEYRLYRVT